MLCQTEAPTPAGIPQGSGLGEPEPHRRAVPKQPGWLAVLSQIPRSQWKHSQMMPAKHPARGWKYQRAAKCTPKVRISQVILKRPD